MASFAVYLFPFTMDIVVGLVLFVGRHSLAAGGAPESVVASIPLYFGIGYFLSGPLMRRIISRRHARIEMVAAVVLLVAISLLLTQTERISLIQALFCALPFAVSLFFNAFQAFLLGFSTNLGRPLKVTVAFYTVAWSMGFGLGPFVSGILRERLSWHEIYYVAAAASALIGVVVLFLHSGHSGPDPVAQGSPSPATNRPDLHVSGWMGVVIGLIGWLVIATYWPVLATRADLSPQLKGLVEFSWAAVQSLGALLLIKLGDWQYRPQLLPLFGLLGIASLLIFGIAKSPVQFLLGASVMGLFTSTTFVYSLYHSMSDAAKASQRVAINEMMVGLGYVIAPAVSTLLHESGQPFSEAFFKAALLLAVLIVIQGTVAAVTKYRQTTLS